MLSRKIRVSITKIILPFFYKIFKLLKTNTRAINFLIDHKINSNNFFDFQNNIDILLKNKKLFALDVGAQGGFNSDNFFAKRYNKYFETVLVDPFKNSLNDQKSKYIIRKGLWSSKCTKKLYVLKILMFLKNHL